MAIVAGATLTGPGLRLLKPLRQTFEQSRRLGVGLNRHPDSSRDERSNQHLYRPVRAIRDGETLALVRKDAMLCRAKARDALLVVGEFPRNDLAVLHWCHRKITQMRTQKPAVPHMACTDFTIVSAKTGSMAVLPAGPGCFERNARPGAKSCFGHRCGRVCDWAVR